MLSHVNVPFGALHGNSIKRTRVKSMCKTDPSDSVHDSVDDNVKVNESSETDRSASEPNLNAGLERDYHIDCDMKANGTCITDQNGKQGNIVDCNVKVNETCETKEGACESNPRDFQYKTDCNMKGIDSYRTDLNGNEETFNKEHLDEKCVSQERTAHDKKLTQSDRKSFSTEDCNSDINKMKEDLDICVCNPVTEKFTTYEIKMQTVNPAFNLRCSHTRRRYNDFCWLRKMLKNHHPMCVCPELPSKKMFSERFEPQFVAERMKALEEWLFRLLEVDLYLSDSTVHLFLQTDLTCKQIEAYVNGRLSSAIVRQAYKACKLKTEHSFMRTMSRDYTDKSEPTEPIQVTRTDRSQTHNKQADSGVTMLDTSSDNDSSYESQSGYSSSSEMNGTFPSLTEITENGDHQQVTKSDNTISVESVNEACVTDSVSTQTISSMKIESKQNSDMTRKRNTEEKRVEMGVIFSINSI